MPKSLKLSLALAVGALAFAAAAQAKTQRALLISVDGLHAVDLERFVAAHPESALAKLSRQGATYTQAATPFPSDSFPGLMALVTGGQPKSTGIWYDDSYMRDVAEAKDCKKAGAEVVYDEGIDAEEDKVDTKIDEKKLVVFPAKACAPAYPHALLRVNTIFDVASAAKGVTAWADKHPAYDIVQGPGGKGVTELFTPEIAVKDTTEKVENTIAYDATKVAAVINEIGGMDARGAKPMPAPMLLGMNFQAVSVAQKLAGGGYLDGAATPSPMLAAAFDSVDASLGRIAAALEKAGLAKDTLFVVTAKHGQSPIDPKARRIVDAKLLDAALGANAAQVTKDDVALIWLKDQGKTAEAAAGLSAKAKELEIAKIWSGPELAEKFGDPLKDPRVPDIIVQTNFGVIYAKPSATKIAEHGGGAADDSHVALLVAAPGMKAERIETPVTTMQVAPTILAALGLDPNALDAVKAEHTQVLPGLGLALTQ